MSVQQQSDFVLDMRGLRCPLPVTRTRRAVKGFPKGATVRIECTDPLAEIDIPHMAATDGHALMESGVTGDVLWYIIKLKI